MRTVVNISFTLDEDTSIDTISYLLDNVGVSNVSVKSRPHFEDWRGSLPKEPVAGLSDACSKWIHSWGSGGGNLSDEIMIKAQLAASNSDYAAEIAYDIFDSVSDSCCSEYDAESLAMDVVNGSIADLRNDGSDCDPEAESAGAYSNQSLAAQEEQAAPPTGKKLRLFLFEDCLRDCFGCCNKDFDPALLPVCHSYHGYDLIMLTGGEPMLYPDVVVDAIRRIRRETTAPIVLYTAMTSDKETLSRIMQQINGLTVTLHDSSDVKAFLEFDSHYCSPWKIAKSLRLNIFKGVDVDIQSLKGRWTVKSNIEWIKNCPLPEGEVLMRYDGKHQ